MVVGGYYMLLSGFLGVGKMMLVCWFLGIMFLFIEEEVFEVVLVWFFSGE